MINVYAKEQVIQYKGLWCNVVNFYLAICQIFGVEQLFLIASVQHLLQYFIKSP